MTARGARLHRERVLERVPGRLDAGIGRVRLVVRAEVADQRAGDTELDVGVEARSWGAWTCEISVL
jgi:hypothetical protein